ncbi:ribonuclease P protein component [soil metagenome]
MKDTFTKQERLSGRKTFDVLVHHGEEFFQFPFRVKWMYSDVEMPFPAQIAFGVPKRNFKKAVERNRIKRMLRECFRKNKHPFYEELAKREICIRVMLMYTHKATLETEECEAKIILTLQRLIKASDAIKSGTKA